MPIRSYVLNTCVPKQSSLDATLGSKGRKHAASFLCHNHVQMYKFNPRPGNLIPIKLHWQACCLVSLMPGDWILLLTEPAHPCASMLACILLVKYWEMDVYIYKVRSMLLRDMSFYFFQVLSQRNVCEIRLFLSSTLIVSEGRMLVQLTSSMAP